LFLKKTKKESSLIILLGVVRFQASQSQHEVMWWLGHEAAGLGIKGFLLRNDNHEPGYSTPFEEVS
jgi:hypothetical protein